LKAEIGLSWIASSKIARKAGHAQTAYSATLQAKEAEAPFAFVQQAKLLKGNGEPLKALTDLENGLKPLLAECGITVLAGSVELPIDVDGTDDKTKQRSLSKVRFEFVIAGPLLTHVVSRHFFPQALSLAAKWAHEADRFSANEVVARYKRAIQLAPECVAGCPWFVASFVFRP
jgi:serine/threonine-protein kinase ATR